MRKILFFHGGPGLNGNPERMLLTARFAQSDFQLICWDEPSEKRLPASAQTGADAYDNYLRSAEDFFLQHSKNEPVIVIGYCFGGYPALSIAQKHPGKIALLVILTPDFCLDCSDRNILGGAAANLYSPGDEDAAALQHIVSQRSAPFAEHMENGWKIVLRNPRLFDIYWYKKELMMPFLEHFTGRYELDPDSFFNVRRTWREPQQVVTSAPTIVCYGRHDTIVDIKAEINGLGKYFSSYKLIELADAGHFPHIEQTDGFLEMLKTEIKSLELVK